MVTPPIRESELALGDTVEIAPDAPAEYRRRIGFVTELGPGGREYRIEFEDGETPTTGYLKAECLRKTSR
jgi:hypothetical protein